MITKTRLVNFRVTEEQYHLLKQKAAADGIAVGAWVRDRVLPDDRRDSLEARISNLERAIHPHETFRVNPAELIAILQGSDK